MGEEEMMDYSALNKRMTGILEKTFAYNFAANHARIRKEFLHEDMSITSIPRAPTGRIGPAMVLGSGASLDDHIEDVNNFAGPIFCSPSQLNILAFHDIRQTFVVSVDAAEVVAEQIGNREDYAAVLLTHPGVSPLAIEAWKGLKRYFNVDAGTGGSTMTAAYPWIRKSFPLFGSVSNMGVQIAAWMGYSPIFLVGVDYCFCGGKTRATNYNRRGPYWYDSIPAPSIDSTSEGTTPEMRFYVLLLLCLWKLHRLNLCVIGDGALEGILPSEATEYDPIQFDPLVDSITEPEGIYAEILPGNQGRLHFAQDDQNEDWEWFQDQNGLWARVKENMK